MPVLNFDVSTAFEQGKTPDPRFQQSALPLLYSAVATGIIAIHMAGLWLIDTLADPGLTVAQTLAALAAATVVYAVRETLFCGTRGAWRWYLGVLPFLLSCAPGLLGDALITAWLTDSGAHRLDACLCGAILNLWWTYDAASRHGWLGR